MKVYNAIIIDDEKFCRETLKYEIERSCPEIQIVDMCENAEKGKEAIEQFQPDLVFLDIEMPYMNGFEMLESMDHIPFKVIFTTAYDQFAIKAIKVNALDYLLKPISKDDLTSAVERFRKQNNTSEQTHIRNLLKEVTAQDVSQKRIGLPTSDGIEMVEISHIIHVKADNNYSEFHLESGKCIIISKTLKQVDLNLNSELFLRIHQSHLINLSHIQKYQKGSGGSVIMSNGDVLPVARNKKPMLLDRLLQ